MSDIAIQGGDRLARVETLRVWRTAGATYRTLGRNAADIALIAWPWAVLAVVIRFVVGIQGWGESAVSLATGVTDAVWETGFQVQLYRLLLRGERAPWGVDLRFGRAQLQYLVLSLALMAAAFAPLAAAADGVPLAGSVDRMGPVALVIVSVWVIAAVVVFVRLTLVFPAIALQDKRVDFAESWRLTEPWYVNLFLTLLLVSLPALVLGSSEAPADFLWSYTLVDVGSGLFLGAVTGIVGAIAYRTLVPPAEPAGT